MIVTKTHLSRRTVLRGLGAAIALPLLDAMVPAFAATAKPVRRFGAVFVGNGVCLPQWTPPKVGALELSPTLQALAPFQDRTIVLSGLENRQSLGQDTGPHPRSQTAWLTGCRAKRTEGSDVQAGVSLDQIVAREFGKETQLGSLELALEGVELLGTCNIGYSCAYNNTIAWRTPTTPLPMENNPRAVFERLFGGTDSTDARARLANIKKSRSILDSVTDRIAHFQTGLGPTDRLRLAEYLDAVHDVERRIQKAEEQADVELPVIEQPVGIPATLEDHATLMFDLLALAYQCDLTRVCSFLLCREASVQSYPEIGVPESHHPLSHHGNDPEKLSKLAKVNCLHLKFFTDFLAKLQATPDGDGSLLDHTLLLYGYGMSDPNIHLAMNIPTVVVGGGETFGIKGGRHLRYPDTPVSNLQLTLLDKLGLPVEHFGDSTGELKLLSDV